MGSSEHALQYHMLDWSSCAIWDPYMARDPNPTRMEGSGNLLLSPGQFQLGEALQAVNANEGATQRAAAAAGWVGPRCDPGLTLDGGVTGLKRHHGQDGESESIVCRGEGGAAASWLWPCVGTW